MFGKSTETQNSWNFLYYGYEFRKPWGQKGYHVYCSYNSSGVSRIWYRSWFKFRVFLPIECLPIKAIGPSLPCYLPILGGMNLYFFQVYLNVNKYNELDWNSNNVFRFLIPSCYPLHHLHIHFCMQQLNSWDVILAKRFSCDIFKNILDIM